MSYAMEPANVWLAGGDADVIHIRCSCSQIKTETAQSPHSVPLKQPVYPPILFTNTADTVDAIQVAEANRQGFGKAAVAGSESAA
jgi:hypothetical protein